MDHEALEDPEVLQNGNDVAMADLKNGQTNSGFEEKMQREKPQKYRQNVQNTCHA